MADNEDQTRFAVCAGMDRVQRVQGSQQSGAGGKEDIELFAGDSSHSHWDDIPQKMLEESLVIQMRRLRLKEAGALVLQSWSWVDHL